MNASVQILPTFPSLSLCSVSPSSLSLLFSFSSRFFFVHFFRFLSPSRPILPPYAASSPAWLPHQSCPRVSPPIQPVLLLTFLLKPISPLAPHLLLLSFVFLFSFSFFLVFHSFTFLQPSPSIAKAPPPVTQSTSSTAASVLISDGWVGETGAGDYYDWLIGNESPPPPPPTSCIHHLYAKRRPLIPHMPHCRASFALFCGTASERENRWPRDRPNPPVTDVLRRNMRLTRVNCHRTRVNGESVFTRNALHLRYLESSP